MSDLRAQEVAILQEYDDEEFLLRQQVRLVHSHKVHPNCVLAGLL